MKEIEIIKSDFYLKTKNNKFYQTNKFNEALFRLTNVLDKLFIKLLFSMSPDIDHLQTEFRFSYRAILKKINEHIDNKTDLISKESLKKDITDILDEFNDAKIFNRIRNAFDRVETGTMKYDFDGDTLVFSHNNIRDINVDLYSRWVDHEKPLLNNKIVNDEATMKSFGDFFDKQYKNAWDDFNDKPKSKYKLNNIFKNCYERVMKELLDISEDIEFTKYTLDEFRKVYSAIQALGVLKMNKYMLGMKSKNLNEIINPSVCMEYNDFIEYIKSCVNIEENKIDEIVKVLIYDYEFHKDKVTIYQPIFLSGSKIFYSTMIVYYAFPQDKIIYYLNKKGNDKQAISKIAQLREKKMTDEIIDFIQEYTKYEMYSNYVLIENNKATAEFDLIMMDQKQKCILLCELKWFTKNDGELDIKTLDRKIVDSIKVRSRRFHNFYENKERIVKEIFGIDIDLDYQIKSCIISENHSGSASIKDEIPIFDRFAFYFSLDSVNYNLKEFFKIIDEQDYLPIPPYEIDNEEFDYRGQKYRCPVIKVPRW